MIGASMLQRGRAPESAEISSEAEGRNGPSRASTGPRSGERGDQLDVARERSEGSSFNGAALRRARRCSRPTGGRGSASRFNGAALRRARRCPGTDAFAPFRVLLQRGRAPESAEIHFFHYLLPWVFQSLQRGRAPESAEMRDLCALTIFNHGLQRGRAPESAEICQLKANLHAARAASTGPRSGERGDVVDQEVVDGSQCSFNGAALRRARRLLVEFAPPAGLELASTGPRSGERGDEGSPHRRSHGVRASTGPRSGERGDDRTFHGLPNHGPASTGPRSGERGDLVAGHRRQAAALASTGPRSGERGDARSPLDWRRGRACFNGAALRRARRYAVLAFGRAVAEGFNGAALRRARRCDCGFQVGVIWERFNGAALRRARRLHPSTGMRCGWFSLQRGRAPESAEIGFDPARSVR